MATPPVKPSTASSVPSSRPNPLHGEVDRDVTLPGTGPKADMAPPEQRPAGEVSASDITKAEMQGGREALTHIDDRTKAEMEAGKKNISRGSHRDDPPSSSER